MSVNGANPVGEVEEPPIDNNGIDYGTYASTSDTTGNSSEEINFSSKDILKREKTKFFTRVEGSEKRAREEERKIAKQERELRERMLKEAEKKDSIKTDVQERAENENLRETKHIKNEFKQRKIREFIWKKRVWILASIAIIAVAVLSIIYIPIIIDNIQRAKNEETVARETTETLKIFSKIVGNEYTAESLESAVEEVNKDAKYEYFDAVGYIELDGVREFIDFTINEASFTDFTYHAFTDDKEVIIKKSDDKYNCSDGSVGKQFDSLEDAISAYILGEVK